jgi:hypothetical protein
MSIECLTLGGLFVQPLEACQLEGPANGGKCWPAAEGGRGWFEDGKGGGKIGIEGEAVGFRCVVAIEADRRDSPLPPSAGEPDRRRFEGVGFIILSTVSHFPLCRNICSIGSEYFL